MDDKRRGAIFMMTMKPVDIDGKLFKAIHVALPKTNLLVVANEIGYIMCAALDVDFLNRNLADREIIAARAEGVRSIEELLDAPLAIITEASKSYGWEVGMTGRDALAKLV